VAVAACAKLWNIGSGHSNWSAGDRPKICI
jgi:hypothetical protein